MKNVDVKTKVYVLMLAMYFPKRHPKAGQCTDFVLGVGNGEKIHTIRNNYSLWENRIEQINSGFAVLSVRVWSGKPYKSKQIEVFEYSQLGIEKAEFKDDGLHVMDAAYIPEYEDVAKNDGLSLEEFEAWFTPRPTEPMAIIHFSDFKYGE